MAKIEGDPRVNQYTATAGQTTFTYEFEIGADSEITVQQNSTTLTITTHYTVTGAGEESGGTVVLVSGATLNDIITLTANTIVKRDTTFTAGGDFAASAINAEFDRLDDIASELITAQGNNVRMAVYSETFSTAIPTPVAGRTIRVNAGGTGFEMSSYDPDAAQTASAASAAAALVSQNAASASAASAATALTNCQTEVTNCQTEVTNCQTQVGLASGYADAAAASAATLDLSAVAVNVVPDADSTRALGSATKAWSNVYTDNVSALGTPASGTLTNCTGYPAASETVLGTSKMWVSGTTLYIATS